MKPPFRLGIVGCGAITELGHAPGALKSKLSRLTTLVDVDLSRAKALGEMFGVADCRDTIDGLENSVDGVVAALPHPAHRPVGTELLRKGLHVLMEKPLGCTVAECDALAEAARTSGRVLATALMRRFSLCNRLAKRIIESGLFGNVISFDIYDGRLFSWPIKTSFLLRPDSPGRGVLIGNGSHFFDLVLWWFGEVAEVACRADTKNGGETDAKVTLRMASGVTGTLQLSRIRQFEDTVTIRFERAVLSLPPFGTDIRITDTDGRALMAAVPRLDDPKGTVSAQMADLMAMQIDDFVSASMGGPGPEVGPDMAAAAIALVERCAAAIEVNDPPWRLRNALPNRVVDQVLASSIFQFATGSSGHTTARPTES